MSKGRPSKYKEEYLELVYEYSLLGLTDVQKANLFKVDVSTLEKWLREKEDFSRANDKGKEFADAKVAKSLYQRAVGYEYEETVEHTDKNGNVTSKTISKKKMAPDTTAASKWLHNRQRKIWSGESLIIKTEDDFSFGEED